MRRLAFAFLFLLLASLASCSGTANPGGSSLTEVQVTLTDYKIGMSLTDFAVKKPYRFVVTNQGRTSHEFVIGPTASGHTHESSLPVIEEDKLPPGGKASLDYSFTQPSEEGALEAACHLPGHYEQGMRLPITVQ